MNHTFWLTTTGCGALFFFHSLGWNTPYLFFPLNLTSTTFGGMMGCYPASLSPFRLASDTLPSAEAVI